MPRDFAIQLLDKAAEDEIVVAKLLGDTEVSDDTLGFHCQQAAEKLLKSILSAASVSYRRTHDIEELLDLLTDNGLLIPSDIDEAELRALTPYAVDYRYVTPVPPTPLDRVAALGLVRRLRIWAAAEVDRLAPPLPSP